MREAHARHVHEQLRCKGNIRVFVTLSLNPEARALGVRIKSAGYEVLEVDSVDQMAEAMDLEATEIGVLSNGAELCRAREQLGTLVQVASELATVAIVDDQRARTMLLKIGVDECLSYMDVDEMLLPMMERALLGHAARAGLGSRGLNSLGQDCQELPCQRTPGESPAAVVISANRVRVNLLEYYLQENGVALEWVSFSEANEVHADDMQRFDLLLCDFDPADPQFFRSLRGKSGEVPVIALCDDNSHGNLSVAYGAADYLCTFF